MEEKELTAREIMGSVKAADPNLDGRTYTFKVAVLLMAAAQVGPGIEALTEFTGYHPGIVKRFIEDAKENGVIKNGKVIHSGWFDEKDGEIAFWLDVATVEGLIKRVEQKTA